MTNEEAMKRVQALRNKGTPWRDIANEFEMHEQTIKNRYHSWKRMTGETDHAPPLRRRFTDTEHQDIEDQLKAGRIYAEIADDMDMCRKQLRNRHTRWQQKMNAKRIREERNRPAPSLAKLRKWPTHWSEMQRRHFCFLRDRGHKQVDVARQLQLEENLVERAWALKA